MSIDSLNKKIKLAEKIERKFVHTILGDFRKEKKFFGNENIKRFLGVKKMPKNFGKQIRHDFSVMFLSKLTKRKIALSLKLKRKSKNVKRESSLPEEKFDFDDINELNSVAPKYKLASKFEFDSIKTESARMNSMDRVRINGIEVTETEDKIKLFTNNLNIRNLMEVIRSLIKNDKWFVEIKNDGNYEPLRNIKQLTLTNIKKFEREVKTIAFKYTDGLYNGLSLILTKNNYQEDSDMPNLFDGEINCVAKILLTLFPKQDDQDLLKEFESDIHFCGCSYDNLKDIAKQLKVNFKIFDRTFQEWKSIDYSKKHKTIKIYVDGNHGILIPARVTQKYPNLETILPDVDYKNEFSNDIVMESRNHPHTHVKILGKRDNYYCANCKRQFDMLDSSQNVCSKCDSPIDIQHKILAFKCRKCEKMYKDSFIYSDFPELWVDGKLNVPKEISYSLTEIGVNFKMFCLKYDFTPVTNELLLPFCTSALHYRPSKVYCQQNELNSSGFDHNGSYRACAKSPLWKVYGMPRYPPTMFFKVNSNVNSQESLKDDILKKTGFSRIKNVNLRDTHQYIRDMKLLQENNVYTNLFLSELIRHGATFEITETAWCLDNIKEISFPQNKYIANAMLGRFMQSSDCDILESIEAKNAKEFKHLAYKFYGDIQRVDKENNNIIYKKQVKSNPKQYPHSYSYIIDYSFTQVLDKIVKIKPSDLQKVKTDAIYVKNMNKYRSEFNPIDWKVEDRKIIDESVYISQFNGCDENKSLDSSLFVNLPELTKFHLKLQKIHRIYGAQGTGKTHLLLENNKLFDAIYLAPTNELVRDKGEAYGIRSTTIHEYFNLCNTNEVHKEVRTNIIMDEAFMVLGKQMEKIMSSWKLKQANLFILYDDFQLPPPVSDTKVITDLDCFKKLPIIKLTINHRQTEPELKQILDFYRNNKLKEEEILARKEFPIITEEELIQNYKHGDRVLTSRHTHRNNINSKLFDVSKEETIPVMIRKTEDKSNKVYYTIENERKVINELFYVSKEEYEENDDELDLAYAATIHCFQGKTIKEGKLYIKMRDLFEKAMFYVAISRVVKRDQIVLVL